LIPVAGAKDSTSSRKRSTSAVPSARASARVIGRIERRLGGQRTELSERSGQSPSHRTFHITVLAGAIRLETRPSKDRHRGRDERAEAALPDRQMRLVASAGGEAVEHRDGQVGDLLRRQAARGA
jgi:hypothetical protein